VATAACGLAQSFHQLLFASIAIALGEAALGPVFYSMVPDLFPGKSRMTANLVYFGGLVIGSGFGVALSGAVVGGVEAHRADLPGVLAHISSWRVAFLVVAAPGALIAAAVALIGTVARRHERGAQEAAGGMSAYFREHWRTAVGLYLAIGFYGLALFASMTWTPVMIIRVLRASAAQVGYGFGAAVSVGSVVGIVTAGALARLLRGRFAIMTPMRIFQASMALAVVPILLMLAVNRPWQAYVLVGIQIAMCTMGTALTPTMLQDIAPGRIRGQVIAVNTVLYSVMGSAAPVLVGFASEGFAGQPRGLLWALVLVSVPALAAAVLIVTLVDRHFHRTITTFAPT
jgi:MFS family permease